jgi:hypothetical protein
MFEQEMELEKQGSSVTPLLLIVTLILVIVGIAGYYTWQNMQVLSSEEASLVVSKALDAQGPVVIHFHAGAVTASADVKPRDPNYRLLEKAGWLKLGRDKGRVTPVTLTAKGGQQFQEIAGARKTLEKDGSDAYSVPIAERKLLAISKVTMNNPSHATVEFTWKWEPNRLGEVFEASGPLAKSFNTWDRGTLIDKYGVNFYHGEPAKAALNLVKTDRGWQIAAE